MTKLENMDFKALKVQAAPLYSQLSSIFRDNICNDKWPVGSALPSEAELARKYGVSVGTARKALESLEEGGWITRKQGRGTFVTDLAEMQFDRFCRVQSPGGGANPVMECRAVILKQELEAATPEEALRLDLREGMAVLRLNRRFEQHGRTMILEHQTLRADLVPGLESQDGLPINLLQVLLRDYGLSIARCVESVTAVEAGADVGALLGVDAHAPLLHTSGLVMDVGGNPVSLVERWFETRALTYSVDLS